MKMLKCLSILLMICAWIIPGELIAQAKSAFEEIYYEVWVPCANDGEGEFISGTLSIHVVSKEEGNAQFWHHQPGGGIMVGAETGNVYRGTGKTAEKWIEYDKNGVPVYYYVNLFHFVGQGIQFFERQVAHAIFIDGDWVYVVDKEEVICK
jgi:hypothetical protein